MVEIISYERAAPAASLSERRALKGIEVAHYVWGGVVGIPFALLLLLGLVTLPFHGLADEPGSRGLPMILRSIAFSAPVAATAWLTFWSGRCIARRRRLRFSLRWSAAWAVVALVGVAYELSAVAAMRRMRIDLMHARGPLALAAVFAAGVAVGVCTYIILKRGSTAALYASAVDGKGP